ncbi:MAG: DUF2142 domain-containing protein [Luteitalea sp.]|nr:DUF2142 domain-containing protein [Luteitalea sp.]
MSRHPIPAFMILALLHGVTMALIRPMFQVSDELVYFSGVQSQAARLVARQPGDPARARLLHADALVYDTPTGKALFRYSGAVAFIAISHIVPLPASATVLRLFFALSLPAAVLATWLLARQLTPRNRTVLLCAPLFVALHPVFVKYASGVTPDAWANAAAMVAVWLAIRIADGTAHGMEPAYAVLTAAVAIALKDTAFFLAALLPLALVLRLIVRVKTKASDPLTTIRSDPWLVALPACFAAGVVALLIVPHAASAIASPYQVIQGDTLSVSRVPAASFAVVTTAWRQVPSLFHSFWGNLGNFGATVVLMPQGIMRVILVLTLVAGAMLFVAGWSHASSAEEAAKSRARLALLLVGCAVLLLQPAVRQVVRDTDDLFQGRWLFPMMSVFAVGLTAGWSTLSREPGRLSLLIGWLLATYAVTAMLVVVVPYYYEQFPDSYRMSGIFVQGTSGTGADPARVLPFIARPALLRNSAFMLGLLGLWLAWLAVCLARLPRWADQPLARTGPSPCPRP